MTDSKDEFFYIGIAVLVIIILFQGYLKQKCLNGDRERRDIVNLSPTIVQL